jgi:hypothetical protein
MDVAERLTTPTRFPLPVKREAASLSDDHLVRSWIRALRTDRGDVVMVHRPWGILTAAGDGKHPIDVILWDGEHSWVAEAPGSTDRGALTLEQVEHVVVDALSSSEPPSWPQWSLLA